jgi:transposase-like protein
MARCEDFPCCGHVNPDGSSDCPRTDSRGRERWKCVECGKELSLRATSSICSSCMGRARRRAARGEEMFPDRENY